MNEIVKYNNYMNELTFKDFEQRDFDLLMALCARMRDLGDKVQVFDYDYLMDLVAWDKTQNVELFHHLLKRMVEKLRKVGATVDINPDEFVSFNLFIEFRGNLKKRTLTVQVNPKFADILNDLSANFTRFELKEYVGLGGRYTKQLYQQLRQRYRLREHYWQPTVDELRQALSIPDSYDTRRIFTKLLKPAIEVIQSCKGFAELTVEPVRSKRRGRAVQAYRFEWTELNQIPGQYHIDDYKKDEEPPKKKRGRPRKQIVESDYGDMDELERKLTQN